MQVYFPLSLINQSVQGTLRALQWEYARNKIQKKGMFGNGKT